MSLLDRILDPFRGRAITIPPYDGAWKPDTRLENARSIAALAGVDALARDAQGGIWASAGQRLFSLKGHDLEPAAEFPAPITALTAFGEGIAVSLADGRLMRRQGGKVEDLTFRLPKPFAATALLASGEALFLAEGSATHRPDQWVPALMRKARDGAVWQLDSGQGQARQIASGLAWPAGLAQTADGTPVVAEAFAHRLGLLTAAGLRSCLDRIPGYPGRLAPAADGGWWLSVFAPRNRLIELVLREDRFRADMLATIPQEQWIAPALSSGHSFLEPLQRGGVRTMGQRKPWASARSYGLVARLDADFRVLESWHSRADGSRHGVTSVLEDAGRTLVALKGAGLIADISAAETAA